jgi:hypothetical protein
MAADLNPLEIKKAAVLLAINMGAELKLNATDKARWNAALNRINYDLFDTVRIVHELNSIQLQVHHKHLEVVTTFFSF